MSNLQNDRYQDQEPEGELYQPFMFTDKYPDIFQNKKRDVFNYNHYLGQSMGEKQMMQQKKRDYYNFNNYLNRSNAELNLMQSKKRENQFFSALPNNMELNYSLENKQSLRNFVMQQKKKGFKSDINITVDNKNLKHTLSPQKFQETVKEQKHLKNKPKTSTSNKKILYNYLKKHERDRLSHVRQSLMGIPTNKNQQKLDYSINQLKTFSNNFFVQRLNISPHVNTPYLLRSKNQTQTTGFLKQQNKTEMY